MLSERLKKSIKDYPNFPKEGIIFKDISPIVADPELFSDLIDKVSNYNFFRDVRNEYYLNFFFNEEFNNIN